MYIRWRNTVTYFDKNLQFFCDNFHNIFFPIFIHTNLDMDLFLMFGVVNSTFNIFQANIGNWAAVLKFPNSL